MLYFFIYEYQYKFSLLFKNNVSMKHFIKENDGNQRSSHYSFMWVKFLRIFKLEKKKILGEIFTTKSTEMTAENFDFHSMKDMKI